MMGDRFPRSHRGRKVGSGSLLNKKRGKLRSYTYECRHTEIKLFILGLASPLLKPTWL